MTRLHRFHDHDWCQPLGRCLCLCVRCEAAIGVNGLGIWRWSILSRMRQRTVGFHFCHQLKFGRPQRLTTFTAKHRFPDVRAALLTRYLIQYLIDLIASHREGPCAVATLGLSIFHLGSCSVKCLREAGADHGALVGDAGSFECASC